MTILYAVLILGVLGCVFGGGLAVAPRSEAGRLWQVGGVPCGKGAARR